MRNVMAHRNAVKREETGSGWMIVVVVKTAVTSGQWRHLHVWRGWGGRRRRKDHSGVQIVTTASGEKKWGNLYIVVVVFVVDAVVVISLLSLVLLLIRISAIWTKQRLTQQSISTIFVDVAAVADFAVVKVWRFDDMNVTNIDKNIALQSFFLFLEL